MKAEMINLYDMSMTWIEAYSINKEDAEWFGDHGVKVHLSEMAGRFLFIAKLKDGRDVDHLPDPGDGPYKAFSDLRKKAAALMGIREDE